MVDSTDLQPQTATGNVYLDALGYSTSFVPGSTIVYVLQGTPGDLGSFGGSIWSAEGRRAAFGAAAQSWAAVANVHFQEAAGPYTGSGSTTAYDWIESFATLPADVYGQHELPHTGTMLGKYNLATLTFVAADLAPGGNGFTTFVHEIGHALGLSHPFAETLGSLVQYGFPNANSAYDYGNYYANQGVFTVMSYNDGYWQVGISPSDSYGFESGPMAFDIAAIQAIYGVNNATNAGASSYVLPSVNAVGTGWSCIWDGGGTDTLSAGTTSFDCYIDLRAATLGSDSGAGGYVSRISGILGGVTIANGVTIENAQGGNGDDWLHGNAGNNVLNGGAGWDTVDFAGTYASVTVDLGSGWATGNGSDTLVSIENANGGWGDDTLAAFGGATGVAAAMDLLKPYYVYYGTANPLDLDYHFSSHASDPQVQEQAGMVTATVHAVAWTSPDNYTFYLASAGTVIIDIDNTFGVDTFVRVYDPNGALLGSNDDGGQLDLGSANVLDSYLSLNVANGGQTLRVEVTAFSTEQGFYDLNVSLASNRVATGSVLIGSRLDGGAGNDVLISRAGADTLIGGYGDDTFYYPDANDQIIELQSGGIDTVVVNHDYYLTAANIENLSLEAGAGNIFAVGSAEQNTITGNEGDNLLIGGGSSDLIHGGGGNDRIYNDGFGSLLYGDGGNDLLVGSAGDDTLDGGTGDDRLYGGGGNDIYYIDSANDLIFEDPGGGRDRVLSSVSTYLLPNIEQLNLAFGTGNLFAVGNDTDNQISGNEGANLLLGGAGQDILSGGSGNDSLYGESGNDLISGGNDIDYIDGGDGNDFLGGDMGADAIYGGAGDDKLYGDGYPGDPYAGASISYPTYDFATDILVGGDGNDILYANSGLGDYDILNGAAGNDTYYVDTPDDIIYEGVGEGIDTVYAGINGAGYYLWANVENCILTGTTPFAAGNELNNVLTGSASANTLLGNDGNDTLNGKAGNDVLFGDLPGGHGTDTFVFDTASGQDVIGDFHYGEDKIQINGIYTSFAQVQSHFSQNGTDGAIDLGGGNFIVLQGVTMSTLTASDFLFA